MIPTVVCGQRASLCSASRVSSGKKAASGPSAMGDNVPSKSLKISQRRPSFSLFKAAVSAGRRYSKAVTPKLVLRKLAYDLCRPAVDVVLFYDLAHLFHAPPLFFFRHLDRLFDRPGKLVGGEGVD